MYGSGTRLTGGGGDLRAEGMDILTTSTVMSDPSARGIWRLVIKVCSDH